jgi:F-type H+-transporting ATPase subunit delta
MERLAVLRYAKALFDIAVEKNQVDVYYQASKDIMAAIETNAEFKAVINHKSIAVTEKLAVMNGIFSGKIPEDFMGLFALMFKRSRQADLLGVLAHMEVLYREYKHIALVKIFAPKELPQQKYDEIAAMLGKKLEKTIIFEKIIDSSLIAGFRIEAEGYVFDASIKNQLAMLKKQLMRAGRHAAL